MSKAVLGAKRRHDGEDGAFLDNYHKHKRYLTQVMASNMNGLKVGASGSRLFSAPLGDSMFSPAQTDTSGTGRSASSLPSHGDDTSTLDSPMSDDSDDSVGYRMTRTSEPIHGTTAPLFEVVATNSTSASSPRRIQILSPTRPSTQHISSAWALCIDADGKLPSSPSDLCQSADLRRTALLRTLQIRSQKSGHHECPASNQSGNAKKGEEEAEHTEECVGQSSPTSNSYVCCCDEMDCNRAILGSPNYGLHYLASPARGSSSVCSLHMGDSSTRSKSPDPDSKSSAEEEEDEEEVKISRPAARYEERNKNRTKHRNPKVGVSSTFGYEVSSSFSGL